MWPLPGEALDRTVAAEAVVNDLYRTALTRWAPAALSAALPEFASAVTAASGPGLPPDPDAVASESSWGPVAESVIVAGVGVLFAAAAVEAMQGMEVPLPGPLSVFLLESATKLLVAPRSAGGGAGGDLGKQSTGSGETSLPAGSGGADPASGGVNPQESAGNAQVAFDVEPAVLAIVNRAAVDMDADDLRAAAQLVDATPALAAARDEVLAAHRAAAARTPAAVAEKVAAAVTNTPRDSDGQVSFTAQRTAAAQVLDPDSADFNSLATASWDLAASVQNRAVFAVAAMSEDADDLEKVWICTLDGRTRDTHWAADGSRVPLNAPFIVGADQLMYPADPTGSPAEIKGCRCRMGILEKGDPLPDEVDRHTERLSGRDSVAVRREGRSQAGEIRKRASEGNTRARDNADGQGTVAAGGWAAPSEQEHDMGETITDATAEETFLTFTDALFAVIGVPTDDRRMLHPDIELSMRDFPIPLQWQERTGDGHKGSVTVGVVESMRRDGDKVFGSGYMLNNEHAVKALDLVKHGVCKPSVDMADATAVLAFSDGTEVTDQNFSAGTPMYEAYKKGTITAATIVAIPAFGQTGLSLNSDREPRGGTEAAMVAAARFEPTVYDPAMFADADPNLLHPHRLRIDPDTGHVFGFLARWTDQHRSVGLGNIKPPRSATNYEHFHTSPGVHLTDGTVLPVGRLTVGVGHAPTRGVSAAAAQAHYDNVESCWALGRVSEHRLGLYFSGVVAPWASPEKVQMGLASPVSGDWRPIGPGRNLELVAVLSVNTPGFLCKVETDSAGAPAAMVASMGVIDDVAAPAATLSLDDIRTVMKDVLAEQEAQAARTARLSAIAARALSLHGEPPRPLSPTEKIAAYLQERDSTMVDEFGIKKVRDSAYWGRPVGTPITKNMKPEGKKAMRPRGKAKGGPTGARASERHSARLDQETTDLTADLKKQDAKLRRLKREGKPTDAAQKARDAVHDRLEKVKRERAQAPEKSWPAARNKRGSELQDRLRDPNATDEQKRKAQEELDEIGTINKREGEAAGRRLKAAHEKKLAEDKAAGRLQPEEIGAKNQDASRAGEREASAQIEATRKKVESSDDPVKNADARYKAALAAFQEHQKSKPDGAGDPYGEVNEAFWKWNGANQRLHIEKEKSRHDLQDAKRKAADAPGSGQGANKPGAATESDADRQARVVAAAKTHKQSGKPPGVNYDTRKPISELTDDELASKRQTLEHGVARKGPTIEAHNKRVGPGGRKSMFQDEYDAQVKQLVEIDKEQERRKRSGKKA